MPENDKVQPDNNGAELAAENARLKAEFASLKTKHDEYESLLLDPKYLDYVANGSGVIREVERPRGTRERPRDLAEEPVSEADEFEAMSKKELVDYVMRTVRGEVRQVVEPVTKASQMREMQAQVKEASAQFADFWDFKDEMIALARQMPGLTAHDAYHIAKGRAGGKPKTSVRSGATPTGGGDTKRKPAEGFQAKFLEAWQQAGFGSKE